MAGGGSFDWAPGSGPTTPRWRWRSPRPPPAALTCARGRAGRGHRPLAGLGAQREGHRRADRARVLGAARTAPPARRLAAARAPARAHRADTAGNGSLMRTAPVALAYLGDPDGLTEAAAAVSAAHPLRRGGGRGLRPVVPRHPARRADRRARRPRRSRPAARAQPAPGGPRLATPSTPAPRDFTAQRLGGGGPPGGLVRSPSPRSPVTTPQVGEFRAAHLRLALEDAVRGGRDARHGRRDRRRPARRAPTGRPPVPARWRLRLHGWPGLVGSDLIALAAAIAEGSR